MKKFLVLLMVFTIEATMSKAQNKNNYTKQWQEIDTLILSKDLPQSALKKVKLLYTDAKKRGLKDQVIKALYDVISGPVGPRNWGRFRSLFHQDAFMAAFNAKRELRKFSPIQYVQNNGPFFMQASFNEKEIGRKVNQFGNVAQVFTAYEFNAGTTPPMTKRGINSIELIKEKGRWFIMSITWDEESKDQPIPSMYLNK